jgi:hypothetical protein
MCKTPAVCSVSGCSSTVKYKSYSLCAKHYHERWRRGEVGAPSENRKTCRIHGCSGSVYGDGLCSMHWQRIRLTGRYDKKGHIEKIFENIEIDSNTGCWNYTGRLNGDGYGVVRVGKLANARVHRILYEFYYDKIPNGLVGCHVCDNRRCCNPNHIFIGTLSDNVHDAVSKGRHARGESVARSKFTREEIIAIRNDPRHREVVASEYGTSKTYVNELKSRRRAWKWLED